MIILTKDEREKFAAWCRWEIESNKEIMEQMKKVPSFAMVLKMKQDQALACRDVARLLESIEDMAAGGGG